MAILQTITFTKDDPNFNTAFLLEKLNLYLALDSLRTYMNVTIKDNYKNELTENVNEVIINRMWDVNVHYEAYVSETEKWSEDISAFLTLEGIEMTKTYVVL